MRIKICKNVFVERKKTLKMNWLVRFWLVIILTYSNLPAVTCVKIMRLKECNKYFGIFSQIYSNRRLKNNNIAITIHKLPENYCVYACIQNLKCESVSYQAKEQLCHLHPVKINKIIEDLEEADGWVYMEPDDDKQVQNYGPVCQRLKPCNYGNCTDDCSSTGYKCECKGCYYGQQCDKHVNDLPWTAWSLCSNIYNTQLSKRQREKEISSFDQEIWSRCDKSNLIEEENGCSPEISSNYIDTQFCLNKKDGVFSHSNPTKYILCLSGKYYEKECLPFFHWNQLLRRCSLF